MSDRFNGEYMIPRLGAEDPVAPRQFEQRVRTWLARGGRQRHEAGERQRDVVDRRRRLGEEPSEPPNCSRLEPALTRTLSLYDFGREVDRHGGRAAGHLDRRSGVGARAPRPLQ